jgi:hypothetical protein
MSNLNNFIMKQKQTLKTIMALICTLFMTFSLHAQWETVSTNGIEDICDVRLVYSDGTNIYAYINGAELYRSTNNGVDWAPFSTGLPASVAITAMTTDGVNLYAAANRNGVYKTPIGVNDWAVLTGGTALPTGNDYKALQLKQDTLFLGVNGAQGVYYTETSTTSWVSLGGIGNKSVLSLAVDTIAGVGSVLVAATNSDNGFFVRTGYNTYVRKDIDLVIDSKPRGNIVLANQGNVIVGTPGNRGNIWFGQTADFDTYLWTMVADGLPSATTINDINLVGTILYLATNRGVWKSSDITTPPISWTQTSNGLQSLRATVYNIASIGTTVYAAQGVGGFKTTDGGANWTKTLNIQLTSNPIRGIRENNGKLYAMTGDGIYESASGNGNDWIKFGTGLNGSVNRYSLVFGTLGTFAASSDGVLYKLNGTAWEPMIIDVPGNLADVPASAGINEIEEVTNGANTYLFGSAWSSAGVYRYDGSNWTIYMDTAVIQNTPGLLFNSADTSQRVIGRMFTYHQASNKLFCFHKNRIQVSSDMGLTWTWRLGNYALNTGTSNIRGATIFSYEGIDYLYIASDITSGGLWSFARTIVNPDPNDSVALVWERMLSTSGENREIATYGNLMFVRGTTADLTTNSGLYITKDGGITRNLFQTNLTVLNVNEIETLGDYLYAVATDKKIYKYDLKTAPVVNSATNTDITVNSALLTVNSTRPGQAHYVILPKTATAPSKTQIMAGLDANNDPVVLKGSFNLMHNVDTNTTITGLADSVNYTCYIVAEDEVTNTSGISTIDFTTLYINPAWNTGAPAISDITHFSATLTSNSTKTGTAYFVVLPQADAAPSIAQVIAGQDGSGAAATVKGNFAVTANADATGSITGLTENTAYTSYVVVQSEYNKTTPLADVDFTTLVDEIKAVTADLGLTVFPNPAKDEITVGINNNYAGKVTIAIIDAAGKKISVIQTAKSAGALQQTINIENLQPGAYFVEIKAGGKEVVKIMKK